MSQKLQDRSPIATRASANMSGSLTVRIVRSWKNPDWFRQTPGKIGIWKGCRFTEEAVANPDYLIVCNYVDEDTHVHMDPSRVWLVVQEPPIRDYRWLRAGYDAFSRIYAPDPKLAKAGHRFQHGCLPWHVDRSYDELVGSALPEKCVNLTWVTSNAQSYPGHKRRMTFLQCLRQHEIPLALYGRGFDPILDKWDALAPARYAFAIENFSGPNYWTEKVADCFLAGAMPLYWGCTNLADYFPEESFVWIDIEDRRAPLKVKELIASRHAEKHREALMEARRRVLEEHHFFAFMSREIDWYNAQFPKGECRDLRIPRVDDVTRYRYTFSLSRRVLYGIRRRLKSSA